MTSFRKSQIEVSIDFDFSFSARVASLSKMSKAHFMPRSYAYLDALSQISIRSCIVLPTFFFLTSIFFTPLLSNLHLSLSLYDLHLSLSAPPICVSCSRWWLLVIGHSFPLSISFQFCFRVFISLKFTIHYSLQFFCV